MQTKGSTAMVDGKSLAAVLLLMGAADVAAATLRVHLGVVDAVASLEPVAGTALPEQPPPAVMDQRSLAFAPHVLAVQRGAQVAFPNSDQVRHHVYSFSPAKRFELRLYAGNEAAPVRFEQAGVVTLGCNIHDRMLGYVVVLDTPWFAVSGTDGIASIKAPAGSYRLRVWHARLDSAAQPPEHDVLLTDAGQDLVLSLPLSPPPVAAPQLTPLQERYRRLRAQQGLPQDSD